MTVYIKEDISTGAKMLRSTSNFLPLYEIGQVVVYKENNLEVEATIDEIDMKTFMSNEGEVMANIRYEMDNGDMVYEDFIIKYYEVDSL